jgi:Protein of unknown function (DUF3093)
MGAYRERLLVPVSYWLTAFPVVVLLGAEAYFFVDGYLPAVTIVVLYAVVAVFLVNWGSATIEVTGGVLRAGRDTLALSDASEAIALSAEQAALLRGPRANPAAHLLLRPYLKRAVCVRLTESAAAAAAPYWLLATRHPEQLAAAIEAARRAGDWPADDPEPAGRQPDDRQPGDWESVG